MTLLDISSVSKYFGDRLLLENCCFSIGEGQHLGFVGVNGCGKTTLFKIIAGTEGYDSGEIFKNKLTKIGFMEQFILGDKNLSAYDQLLEVFSDVEEMEKQLEIINRKIDQNPDNIDELIEKQHQLREQFEARDGLTYKSRARSALLGLGFTEEQLSQKVSTLSGGQAAKVQLAKLLLSGANLLLLDEPTNHLDIKATEWLEEFLRSFGGAFIVISHDRYFLDRVCGGIIELENRKTTYYSGGYTKYFSKKKENAEIVMRHYINAKSEIERLEGSVTKLKSFNREKSIKAAESKMKHIERLERDLVKPESGPDSIHFNFAVKNQCGNDVLITDNLTLYYGDKLIFENVNINIYKSERVFLLGSNGCGKSSLFKILAGRQAGSRGIFRLGSMVDAGYFDQVQAGLNLSSSVINEIWDMYPKMTETEVRNALAAFLFRGDEVFKEVSALSGGERARLAILKLMLSQDNLLLLDEPTNHLDISSREMLENALDSYEGTLFIISHDRYFINKLANRIYVMENSAVEQYDGNYDDYIEKKQLEKPEAAIKKNENKNSGANSYKAEKEQRAAERKRLSRIKKLEEEIEKAENDIESLGKKLADPELSSNYEEIMRINGEIEKRTADLDLFLEEWTELCEG